MLYHTREIWALLTQMVLLPLGSATARQLFVPLQASTETFALLPALCLVHLIQQRSVQ